MEKMNNILGFASATIMVQPPRNLAQWCFRTSMLKQAVFFMILNDWQPNLVVYRIYRWENLNGASWEAEKRLKEGNCFSFKNFFKTVI